MSQASHPPVLDRKRASARKADGESWSGAAKRERFAALFSEHFEGVFRYLDRLSGDPDLASDIAQEAFIRLYRRRTLPDDLRAWLFTVASNLFRNSRRQRATRLRLLTFGRGAAVHSDPAPPPDRGASAGETSQRVRAALSRMRDRDRSLLLLAAEGYSYREMAKITGLREGSVGTLLRRAKETFRGAYEEMSNGS